MNSRLAQFRSTNDIMNNHKTIDITKAIFDEIRTQAHEEMPNEACGYLIGENGIADSLHRMTNADGSPEHFSFTPEEQFAALSKARALNKKLAAVYHTHPVTPPRMSQEDIRLANDSEIVYVIYAVATDSMKAFKVTKEKDVIDVLINVTSDEEKDE